jgi:predicted ATPase
MVEFGECRLDMAARQLWRGGEAVHLEPQAFDVLAFLVEQRSRVVPKQELLDVVWGHRFVSESALSTRIKEIRRAVGDDGRRQAVIVNVRGRGYRFVAPIRDVEAGPDAIATSRLIGRRDDIAEVSKLLTAGAVVTIVGPGGVGKTTLAREICRSLDPAPVDGVIVSELAELSEAEAVLAAVARAADVIADERDLDLLARTICPLDAVLLLDNCEHVIDTVALLIKAVVVLGGSLRVLATSRERLGIPGERVWPLLPLDQHDGCTLFVRRATAARPNFRVDDNEDDLVAIVQALDGLPLAIEMAAARVTSSSLRELRSEVVANRTHLRSPDRASSPRHRTLDALVAWSVDLLTDDERRLFTELSAFSAPVPFEDVREMLDDPPALGARLGELVDRHLVVADATTEGTRFRMLETVRAAAAADAPPALAERHARWAANAAAEADRMLRTGAEAVAVTRMSALTPELRAAFRWGIRHAPALAASVLVSLHLHTYWRLWPEPTAWGRELLARDLDAATTAAAAMIVAGDAANRGRLDEARQLGEVGAASTDPRVRGASLEVLLDLSVIEQRYDAAREWSRQLLELGRNLDDMHMQSIALVELGLSATYADDRRVAEGAAAELEQLRPTMAPSDAAWFTYLLAELADPEDAVPLLADVVRVASSVDNHLLVSIGQDTFGLALCRTNRLDEAAVVLDECLVGFLRHGHYTQTGPVVVAVIELLRRRGDEQRAHELADALQALIGRNSPQRGDRDDHRELFLAARAALGRG